MYSHVLLTNFQKLFAVSYTVIIRDRPICFFGADTYILAIHGTIADISKFFKPCFLLHYPKCNAYYALPFFQKI